MREENSNERSDSKEPIEMGTKPAPEHQWLQQLVGEWRTEHGNDDGDWGSPTQKVNRLHESVKSLGGLWALTEGKGTMPDGTEMTYYVRRSATMCRSRSIGAASVASICLRTCGNMTGELSADGKVMTLNCVGPNMFKDGETANYRDTIEIVDANHRTLTATGQDENGEWQVYMKSHYTRV